MSSGGRGQAKKWNFKKVTLRRRTRARGLQLLQVEMLAAVVCVLQARDTVYGKLPVLRLLQLAGEHQNRSAVEGRGRAQALELIE